MEISIQREMKIRMMKSVRTKISLRKKGKGITLKARGMKTQ